MRVHFPEMVSHCTTAKHKSVFTYVDVLMSTITGIWSCGTIYTIYIVCIYKYYIYTTYRLHIVILVIIRRGIYVHSMSWLRRHFQREGLLTTICTLQPKWLRTHVCDVPFDKVIKSLTKLLMVQINIPYLTSHTNTMICTT
jgi:hypothetical protein